MPPAPMWAQNLVLDVALAAGRDDVPDLTWRRSRKAWGTSGCYVHGDNRIVVTAGAGRDRREERFVLLHELAHWLVQDGHTNAFWEQAFRLYRQHGLVKVALAREPYPSARRWYHRNVRRSRAL